MELRRLISPGLERHGRPAWLSAARAVFLSMALAFFLFVKLVEYNSTPVFGLDRLQTINPNVINEAELLAGECQVAVGGSRSPRDDLPNSSDFLFLRIVGPSGRELEAVRPEGWRSTSSEDGFNWSAEWTFDCESSGLYLIEYELGPMPPGGWDSEMQVMVGPTVSNSPRIGDE